MLKNQAGLPHLPVNPLDKTLERFIESTKPYAKHDSAAADKLLKDVEDFKTGMGPALQRRLEERAKSAEHHEHWLEEWWDRDAYMAYRESVVINVTYFYKWRKEAIFQGDPVLEKSTALSSKQLAARAAQIAIQTWGFRHEVESETLAPDMNKTQPLDMASYKWMFNACRYPAKPADYSVKFKAEESQYIIVIRKDRYFRVEMQQNGKDVSPEVLAESIRQVYDTVGNNAGQDSCLGLLTADNRDHWTDNREILIKDPRNAKSLKEIEIAAFVICLDDALPKNDEEINPLAIHSDGTDRFWDKPIQFVIYDNGAMTFNGEHSMMDGTPVARMQTVVTETLAKQPQPREYPAVSSAPPPTELPISIPAEVLDGARKRFEEHTSGQAIQTLDFKEYGKNSIKKWGVSPDAYIQMAIQLASARLYAQNGKIDYAQWPLGTYEAGSTRMYKRGRTETVRTVTTESVAFVEAVISAVSGGDANHGQLVDLLKKAAVKHVDNSKLAAAGAGVDRHFFGLKHLLKEGEQAPALFSDPIFVRSSKWLLSTSQINSPLHLVGFGQVYPDGWGIGYDIQDDGIHFSVLARKWQVPDGRDAAKAMYEELEWAMQTLARINSKSKL